jgi:hypothetical protein
MRKVVLTLIHFCNIHPFRKHCQAQIKKAGKGNVHTNHKYRKNKGKKQICKTKSICRIKPRPLSGHFHHTWTICLLMHPLQNAPKFKLIEQAKGGSQMLGNSCQSMGSLLTKLDNSTAWYMNMSDYLYRFFHCLYWNQLNNRWQLIPIKCWWSLWGSESQHFEISVFTHHIHILLLLKTKCSLFLGNPL